jgi:hypothetical protein
LLAHADQIFGATQYLSRESYQDRLRAVFLFTGFSSLSRARLEFGYGW